MAKGRKIGLIEQLIDRANNSKSGQASMSAQKFIEAYGETAMYSIRSRFYQTAKRKGLKIGVTVPTTKDKDLSRFDRDGKFVVRIKSQETDA